MWTKENWAASSLISHSISYLCLRPQCWASGLTGDKTFAKRGVERLVSFRRHARGEVPEMLVVYFEKRGHILEKECRLVCRQTAAHCNHFKTKTSLFSGGSNTPLHHYTYKKQKHILKSEVMVSKDACSHCVSLVCSWKEGATCYMLFICPLKELVTHCYHDRNLFPIIFPIYTMTQFFFACADNYTVRTVQVYSC